VLTFLGLGSLVVMVGTPLLLCQALSRTSEAILAAGPDLVIRRVDPAGAVPLNVHQAVSAAASVAGVVRLVPRLWGTVAAGPQAVTVHSADPATVRGRAPAPDVPALPPAGQAVLGPGLSAGGRAPAVVSLHGSAQLTLAVAGSLGPETGAVLNDVVILNPADARRLLGLEEGQATDLAVDVFHEAEAQAIVGDLAHAFPWPVAVVTRKQAGGAYASSLARRGSLAAVAGLPALLGLALLTAATVRRQIGCRSDVGLFKALGWTTGDVLRHQILQALVVGFPAVAGGALVAYALVFWPGVEWPGRLFLGWDSAPPKLYLDTGGAGVVLAELAALVVLPYLTAVLWPALNSAAADPVDLLEKR
jgi:hypothetical protein